MGTMNTTLEPIEPYHRFTQPVNNTILIAALIIIIGGIMGNLLVLLVVIRAPAMRSPMYLCLSSLSASDLLVLVVTPIIPLSTLFNNPPLILGEFFCYLTNLFDRGSLVCSVLTVLMISIERFIVTHHPMRASIVITSSRTLVSLVLIWLVSYGLTAPQMDMTYYELYTENENGTVLEDCSLYALPWHDVFLTFISVAFFVTPLLTVTVLNVLTIRKVLAEPPCHGQSSLGTRHMRQTRRQAVKMISLVVILFILCTAPFQIIVFIEIYGHDMLTNVSQYEWSIFLWIGRFLAYVNSAANPIIYSLVSTKFRSAMMDSVLCCRRKAPTRNSTTCETISNS